MSPTRSLSVVALLFAAACGSTSGTGPSDTPVSPVQSGSPSGQPGNAPGRCRWQTPVLRTVKAPSFEKACSLP